MDKMKSKKVAALTHEPEDDQESDFDETEVWAMTCGECDMDSDDICGECDIDAEDMFDDSAWGCTCGCEVLKALSIPPPTDSTPVCNIVEALAEVDEEENDEDDMIKALQQIRSNITVGPKKSQKQKKATAAPSPLNRKKKQPLQSKSNLERFLFRHWGSITTVTTNAFGHSSDWSRQNMCSQE